MPFSWVYPQYTRFDADDVARIIETAIRLAAQVPWTVDAPDEFYDGLASFGFRVNGNKVHPTQSAIDETLGAIDAHREGRENGRTGETPPASLTFSVSGQAIWCCDPVTDKMRAATEVDLAWFSHVVNAIPGLGRSHPSFIPQDVPLATQDLHTLVTLLLNSEKPCLVNVYSPEMVDYFYRAYSIYYGSEERGLEAMASDALHPATVYINTPFMLSREVTEAALLERKLTGRRLSWYHMPVMGAATPVTIDGALALSTAEAIGANAFALALDGQVCGWLSPGLCAVDIKSLTTTQWGSEVLVAHQARDYVGQALFGARPGRSCWSGCAAKQPGAQSMMERSFGFGMGFLGGARSFGGLAMLAFSDIGSVVQLMLDLELVGMLEKMAQGFEVNADTLAEEVIREVAPSGARFLETEHTARHFRDVLWMPQFMDRQVATSALEDTPTMVDNARTRALRLIETAPNRCPLDQGQKTALERLLQEADAVFE